MSAPQDVPEVPVEAAPVTVESVTGGDVAQVIEAGTAEVADTSIDGGYRTHARAHRFHKGIHGSRLRSYEKKLLGKRSLERSAHEARMFANAAIDQDDKVNQDSPRYKMLKNAEKWEKLVAHNKSRASPMRKVRKLARETISEIEGATKHVRPRAIRTISDTKTHNVAELAKMTEYAVLQKHGRKSPISKAMRRSRSKKRSHKRSHKKSE